MRARFLIILCLFSLCTFAQNTHILPTPQQVESAEGQFVWDDDVVLTYDASDAEIRQIVTMLRQDLEQISLRKTLFSKSIIRGRHYVELLKTDHLGTSLPSLAISWA